MPAPTREIEAYARRRSADQEVNEYPVDMSKKSYYEQLLSQMSGDQFDPQTGMAYQEYGTPMQNPMAQSRQEFDRQTQKPVEQNDEQMVSIPAPLYRTLIQMFMMQNRR